LVNRRNELLAYNSAEDLGFAAYGERQDPNARALVLHLEEIRNALVDALWARQIFIGPEVLDDLLLSAAVEGSPDPLSAVLEFLRDRRASRPGLVIFGLHSFGVLGGGLFRGPRRISFIHPGWGMALSPQTNQLARTTAFLEEARLAFGVHKPLSEDLLEHWLRSRAPWLESNPLLAMRVVNQRGSYYSTEWPITVRLRATTALIAMTALFQNQYKDEPGVLMSSSMMNNWETLDIHHYFVLYDNPGHPHFLDGDAVPIHARGRGLAELSELNVELDPTARSRRRLIYPQIEAAVSVVMAGHLNHVSARQRKSLKGRVYRRAFDSLDYFRRSFPRGGATWSAVVSLSTAFEMLLTDNYARGVSETLKRRTGLLLKGVRGRSRYESAVKDLYDARSAIVHEGSETVDVDLAEAQRAFVHAFAVLGPRIERVRGGSQAPLADLTGDSPSSN